MKPTRRNLVAALICGLGAAVFPAGAPLAADYTGTVRVMVGFPPGGATDVIARIMSEKLKDMLGQPVIVDNKPGAGGMVATQALKAAAPDGATVMLTIDHSHVVIPLTFKAPGYDPLRDFTPLAGVASYYNAMVVASQINVKSMSDFGTWLKANPGKNNFGIPAAGSVPQFAGILVGKALGTPMVAIPYKGGAPLVSDLLGAQVPAGMGSLTEYIEHHRAGKLVVLAVSGTTRAKAAPEIPTFQELGLKGIDKNPWLAFFGPKGMPKEFVDRFSAAVATALRDPDVSGRLAKMGNEATYATPDQLQEWVSSATAHWGPVIRESGFALQ